VPDKYKSIGYNKAIELMRRSGTGWSRCTPGRAGTVFLITLFLEAAALTRTWQKKSRLILW